MLCIRSKNSQASFLHVCTFIFSCAYVLFCKYCLRSAFLMKGIAQLYVANIVQDADTQFVFAIKKNFLNFYTWYKMWQLSFICHLPSFVNRNCSNSYAHLSLSGSRVLMMNWEYESIKSECNHIGFIFCANKKH